MLVRDVFHGGPERFSMAVGAFGAGGLMGAVALLAIPPTANQRRLSVGFALLYGAVLMLTAITPWFWGIPALLVVAGASMTMSNTAANALLQSTTPRELLGQTVGLYMLAMRGGISLGALITGATVTVFGVQHALLLDGALAIVVQMVLTRL